MREGSRERGRVEVVLVGGAPVVQSPAGQRSSVEDAAARLSAATGRTLGIEAEADVQHDDESPVHLPTAVSLGSLGVRRGSPRTDAIFRPAEEPATAPIG